MKLFFKIILFVGLTHVALSKDHRALRMSPTTTGQASLQPGASVQGDPKAKLVRKCICSDNLVRVLDESKLRTIHKNSRSRPR